MYFEFNRFSDYYDWSAKNINNYIRDLRVLRIYIYLKNI